MGQLTSEFFLGNSDQRQKAALGQLTSDFLWSAMVGAWYLILGIWYAWEAGQRQALDGSLVITPGATTSACVKCPQWPA